MLERVNSENVNAGPLETCESILPEKYPFITHRPAYAERVNPNPSTSGWRSLSVFSGCGGLDLGFLQEGIFSEKAIDIDKTALETYRTNITDAACNLDLFKNIPIEGTCTILLAGAPCQGFSTAGKRRLHDPRNELLMKVADIAIANQSKVVIVENVPAALSGAHRYLWIALEDRLRLSGYNVRRLILDGSSCGMAQRRKRLFIICWKGSDCINIFFENRGSITLREALGAMPSQEESDFQWPLANSKDFKIIQKIKPSQKLSNVRLSNRAVATWDIPEVFGYTSEKDRAVLQAVAKLRRRDRVRSIGDGDPVSIERINSFIGADASKTTQHLVQAGFLRIIQDKYELAHTYNGRYRRLDWDDLSPTVDTKFGRVDLFVHPEEARGMTPAEASRIQGFPDGFKFCGTKKEQFTQIGNAVPPPMASVLATTIREAILKG